jgi:hypothetical protein
MKREELRSEESKHKSLIVGLIAGIVLALGPLWGAIVAVLSMSQDYFRLKAEIAAGVDVVREVAMPILPIAIGFVICPIGISIVVINVLQLSEKIRHARKKGL